MVQTGVATVLVLAVNVVTGIVSARVLGPQGRGELSALLLCPQFLSFLFTLGLPSSTIVRIKGSPASASGLMGAALLLSGVMGLLAASIGLLIMPHLLKQYDSHVINVARALLAFVMLGVTSTVLVAALQLSDRFVAYNRLRFWQSALTLLSLGGLAAAHRFTPEAGALAYVLPTLPFFGWNLWWVLKEFKPRLSDWREHCRELLSYGWRVHVIDTGNTLFGQLDKLILVAVLAPSVFGLYVVVFNVSRLVTTFANSATPVLLPRSAGKSAGEVLSMTSRALTATSALTMAAVVGFVLLGGLGLRWLYGEQFAAGYGTLVILSIEGALSSSAAVLQQPYVALHRPGTVALFQTFSLSLGAALIYLLARRFGAEGAACGLLLATSARFTLTYSGFAWLLGLRAPRLLPTRTELLALLNRPRVHIA
ncbi:MAG: lipopolysaccharide biosynthesis protein [Steroidobacteraceae bacterium]